MKFLATSVLFFGIASGTQAAVLETFDSGVETPDVLGGYFMKDFPATGTTTGTTSTLSSPISGSLEFIDRDGNPEEMVRSTADNTDWWVNSEDFDYDVFLTGESLITILLPENTRAFSFNVGANSTSTVDNAWLSATESSGSGVSVTTFNVNRTNTPGFGIYAGYRGDCSPTSSTLTSITIDPVFWGFGNFSISQTDCSTVPESPSLTLLLIGLLGLFGFGFARRKN